MDDMQSPPPSMQKIQKMNNSSVAFRQLIQNLREKNRNIGKQVYSQMNPESASEASKHYASEQNWKKSQVPISNTFLLGEDDVIKIKPRGNVAGRDILKKKPQSLHNSKFSNTVALMKTELKNKNVEEGKKQIKLPEAEPVYPKIKPTATHEEKVLESRMVPPSISMRKSKSFNQNRLNQKMLPRKKIKDVDEQKIIKYWENSNALTEHSQAPQIFDFFQGLVSTVGVSVGNPFIKKYKNCIYFGHQITDQEKYQGFLYFYEKKFYFGEFINGQKNGQGTEIYFNQGTIYKGIFKNGQKTGKFFVSKPHEQYTGILEKGLYHGDGKLTTKQSTYEGAFHKGEKHGFGEEIFPATGLKFTGYFNRGQFQKRSKSTFANHESQVGRGISFKNYQSKGREKAPSQATEYHKNRSYDNFRSKKNRETFDDGLDYAMQNPFSSYKPPSKRSFYNKDKIMNYVPRMKNVHLDEMPQNCQQFDYSFDVSSRKESQANQFGNWTTKKQSYGLDFPQIDEERMDTTQYEEPLPVPCFYGRH